MQLKDDMLEYPEALDNLHLNIVLQLLQAGADVQAVTAQVRPAALLCISALLLSFQKTWSFCRTCNHRTCILDMSATT